MQKLLSVLLVGLLFFPADLSATIRLPRLISDGAILQRDTPVELWGWAAPRERITLTFGADRYTARADRQGRWTIDLPAQAAGGPHRLTFAGENEIVLEDVYFGDVWICSGQSNMELNMGRVKEKYLEVIGREQNPLIRQFLVPDAYDFRRERDDLDGGAWVPLTRESVFDFVAVAYFFAQEVYTATGVPIGLINAALGGSPIESWLSEESLREFPAAYAEWQRFKSQALIDSIEAADRARNSAWYGELQRKDRGLAQGWHRADLDDADWAETEIPGFWADTPTGELDGVVWYRKTVTVPQSMAGQPAALWLGRIIDQDFAYLNDSLVGTTGYQYPPRRYYFGPGILRAGENTIAVRVVNSSGRGGFVYDKPYHIATATDTLPIAGTWKFRVGGTMESLAPQTFVRWQPGGLYNRMIHPLQRYRIKGVIWYQGESNVDTPTGYGRAFAQLIEQWRADWGQGDFPFLFVQLANLGDARYPPVASRPTPTTLPAESNWAELRAEQAAVLDLPNTGMAVTIDVGEWNDIHPLDKASVGHRLALLARKVAYGEKNLVADSPRPIQADFREDKVVIELSAATDGLVLRGGATPRSVAISADGENFVWATATIDGNQFIVRHPAGKRPVAVRYAWADNPEEANVYNRAGLPVAPFEVRR
jgi:sialate O-acetylesterase